MMNIHTLKENLTTLHEQLRSLNNGNCVPVYLVAGGAMVMLDIRETTEDIDLQIPLKFEKFIKTKFFGDVYTEIKYGNNTHIKNGVYDIQFKNISLSGDLTVQPAHEILKLKLEMNREKDKRDIVLLRGLLNEKV